NTIDATIQMSSRMMPAISIFTKCFGLDDACVSDCGCNTLAIDLCNGTCNQLEVLINGVFDRKRVRVAGCSERRTVTDHKDGSSLDCWNFAEHRICLNSFV